MADHVVVIVADDVAVPDMVCGSVLAYKYIHQSLDWMAMLHRSEPVPVELQLLLNDVVIDLLVAAVLLLDDKSDLDHVDRRTVIDDFPDWYQFLVAPVVLAAVHVAI